jgi:molybdopterin/thiamine biosynthesis adenylyltransferase
MNGSRYDRQERVRGWDQRALAEATVLVVGAGALGNETVKNLALLGVGHLLIVDFDRIEPSNLSRTVLFRPQDVGRHKAEIAAVRARELNPDIDVLSLKGDVFYDVGLGFYRRADLVIGCLDNIAARSQVGIGCSLAGTPYLDGGMWGLGGEVRWFLPGETACFECTLTGSDRQRSRQRLSCTGLGPGAPAADQPASPATIHTAAIIGGLLAQETTRLLFGWGVTGGEAFVYNGLSRKAHRASLPRDPGCPYHSPYREVFELDQGPETLTGSALLEIARDGSDGPAVIELGRDFLRSFHCPRCGQVEEVNRVLGLVDEARSVCPRCGHARQPVILARIEGSDEASRSTLAALGVPPREILAVRGHERVLLYELAQ